MQVQAINIYNQHKPNSVYQYKHTNHSINNNSKNNISFGSKVMLDIRALSRLSRFPKEWQQRFIEGLNSIRNNGAEDTVFVDLLFDSRSVIPLKRVNGRKICNTVRFYGIGITNEENTHFFSRIHMITTPEQERYRTGSVPFKCGNVEQYHHCPKCDCTKIDHSEYLQSKGIRKSDVYEDMVKTYNEVKKVLDKRCPDNALNRKMQPYERDPLYRGKYIAMSEKAKMIKDRISKLSGELGIIDESKGNHNNPIVLQNEFWQNLEYRIGSWRFLHESPVEALSNSSFEFLLKQLDSLKDLKHDNIICIGCRANSPLFKPPFYNYLTISIIEKRGDKIFINKEPIDTFKFYIESDGPVEATAKRNLVDYYNEAHTKLVPVDEEDSEIYNYYYDLIYKNFKSQNNKSNLMNITPNNAGQSQIPSSKLSHILNQINNLTKQELDELYAQMQKT